MILKIYSVALLSLMLIASLTKSFKTGKEGINNFIATILTIPLVLNALM